MVHTFICINLGNHLTNSCSYKIKLSSTTFKIKTRKNYSFQSFLPNMILSNIFLEGYFRKWIKSCCRDVTTSPHFFILMSIR